MSLKQADLLKQRVNYISRSRSVWVQGDNCGIRATVHCGIRDHMAGDVMRFPSTISSCLVLLLLLLGTALARGQRDWDRHHHEPRMSRGRRPPRHPDYEDIPVPMECPWFTNALFQCMKTRMSMRRFQLVTREMRTDRFISGFLSCLTVRSVEAPDKIYCTDKESVHILKSCVKDNLSGQSRAQRQAATVLLNEMEECLHYYHYDRLSVLRHRTVAHHLS
ncbi:uncharacterized protein [Dermacentor andersoni]|uniref:uncharacterized protein isoform X1 n=2 Tax=Dermacentor andersoni TaxID=34620 RepID=UPI003B3B079F